MTSRNMARAGALAILMTSVAAPAFAGSFYLQEQSARGMGRANSGETADKGVESMWWNAASIARSGREVTMSLHAIRLDAEATNDGSYVTYTNPTTGARYDVPVTNARQTEKPLENGLVPNFAIAMPLTERLAVGVAVAAPYNFTTKYSDTSFARYDAGTSELRSADLGLTAAYQVNDWLDVGAGVNVEYVKAKLTSAMPGFAPTFADGSSSLEGDGFAYGWNVGAQVHTGKWDLGLSYRSAMEHELEGDIVTTLTGPLAPNSVNSAGSAEINTPWFASASVRYAATDKLTLNAQINRIGWSEFDAIRVSYTGGGDTIHQNYEDVTTGAIGLDYAYSAKTTLRAGVAYDPTPTTDQLRTARIPDADRTLFSVGLNTEVTEGIGFDAAVTYIAMNESKMHDDRNFYNGLVTSHLRGDIEGSGLVFSMGTTIKF